MEKHGPQVIAQPIVIDSSAYLTFLLPDEHDAMVERAFGFIHKRQFQVIVPDHFYIEVYNSLRYMLTARAPRITPAQYDSYAALFLEIGIYTENTGHNGMYMLGTVNETQSRLEAMRNSAGLALKYDLSVYDAAYLELAIRKQCKLVTLDRELAKAAEACAVLFV